MAVTNHRFETLLRHTVTTRCYEALLADTVKSDLWRLLVTTASRAMVSQRCLLTVSLKSDRWSSEDLQSVVFDTSIHCYELRETLDTEDFRLWGEMCEK